MSVVHRPEEMNERWADAFNAGDVRALLDLFEPHAVVVPGPGAEPVRGHDAIKATLEWFIGLGGSISFEPRYWIQQDDIATGSVTFQMHGGKDPDGKPVDLAGTTVEVLRRQSDDTWKYVIDHPFGGNS